MNLKFLLSFFAAFLFTSLYNYAQISLITQTEISDKGLYFEGEKGVDYQFGKRITPHGDCIDIANGYLFVSWYRGEVSPSGKSPVTVPRSIGQLPFHYSAKEINNKKGYLFMEDGPIYPFGHGLSYADIEYSDLELSSNELSATSEITVTVELTNNGSVEGKEVVQMYIKDEIGSVVRPDKELKGFQKIELSPGETKLVEFKITSDMLEFTGVKMDRILEAGNYQVMLGTSSKVGKSAKFRLSI